MTLTDAELEHLRGTNLGRLLDQVHLLFDRRALGYLREAGYTMIKAADTHVLRTMRMEGARITDMAEQAGISKQAMSKLVAQFAEYGFVEWEADPDDGRSRIVRHLFAPQGNDIELRRRPRQHTQRRRRVRGDLQARTRRFALFPE